MKALTACALAGALVAGPASAGSGIWTSDGPWGGTIYALQANPATPSILYASTRGGLFRSDDAGVTWVRKQAGFAGRGNVGTAFAMDAQAPGTLWAMDSFGRVNRSTDAGENWAQTGYTVPTGYATAVVDAPGVTGRLYVLPAGAPGILASSDNGVSFSALASGLPGSASINRLAIDPTDPLRMIAGTEQADADPVHPYTLFLSTDGGATWSGTLTLGIPPDLYHGWVQSIRFGAGNTVYAAVSNTIYRSDNKGLTWSGPMAPGEASWAEPDPVTPNTVMTGGRAGVKVSADGGATTTPLNAGLLVTAGVPATVTTILMHPNYPAVPHLWIGTEDAGIYFSADNAATWNARNDGLAGTNIRALAMFHSASTHRLFAGYGDPSRPSPALFRGNTTAPGAAFSWAPSNTGLAAYQIRALAIDPTTTGGGIGSTRIFASGRAGQVSLPADARNGGLYRSSDGGNTWSTIDTGLPPHPSFGIPFVGTVRALVLDPRSCASPPSAGPCVTGPLQTLYATANGVVDGSSGSASFRILKSTNGGNSWTSSDNGIPQPAATGAGGNESVIPVPIVVNPVNPQELFVGTFLAGLDSAPPTLASGVFRSTDGGATWSHRSNGLPRMTGSTDTAFDVLSLAINPTNPLEIWCSVIDLVGGTGGGGIYRTIDGGASWTNSSTGLLSADIRAIYVDPAAPSVLYASGGGTDANPGNIYKSTNSGASWQSISIGLPADAALALLVDPVEPKVLYAGTTSGVWSLTQVADADGDGVPDSVEMSAPNAGDGNRNGVSDHLESNVGSLTSATGEGSGRPLSPSSYFTVAITPLAGSCTQAVDVQSIYAVYHGADRAADGDLFAYPHQLARFEIRDCDSASVTLKFHGARFGTSDSLRFHGPSTPGDPETIGWHDFSTRAVRIAQDTWRLTLDNGQFGSYRPITAHSILFEGGPAWKGGLFRDDFD
jgi:photosystem II stability/assembly factor-like uncharacterized protein